MNIKEDIRPITVLKNRAADLLAQVNETQRPIVITQNGVPKGVLQDPESYERMRRAVGMLKMLAQGEENVRTGRTVPQSEVFGQLRKQLKARGRADGKTEQVPG